MKGLSMNNPVNVKVNYVCDIDNSQFPKLIEVNLVDSFGNTHTFIDKESVFESADGYAIRAIQESKHDGLIIINTSMPDGVESSCGTTTFTIDQHLVI